MFGNDSGAGNIRRRTAWQFSGIAHRNTSARLENAFNAYLHREQ
jgi:hypothetical protein